MIIEPSWKQPGFFKDQICDNNQSYGFNKTPKIQQREVLWGRTTGSQTHEDIHTQLSHLPVWKCECTCRADQCSSSFATELSKNTVWLTSPRSLLLTTKTFDTFCICLCLGPLNQEHLSPEIYDQIKKCNWSEIKLTLRHNKVKTDFGSPAVFKLSHLQVNESVVRPKRIISF